MKTFVVLLFTWVCILPVFAQTSITWEDFLQNYFTTENLEPDLLQELEDLHNHPMNLNMVSSEELQQLPFLSESKADSIIAYRTEKKHFRFFGELMFIKNLTYDDRLYMQLFTFVGEVDYAPVILIKRLFSGKHKLITHLGVPLYRRAGFRTYSDEELEKHPNKIYLGNKLKSVISYRYKWRENIKYGITLRKDSGEPFGYYGNYPFDDTSLYFDYRMKEDRFRFVVGDYKLKMGQGLLLGNLFFKDKSQLLNNRDRSAFRFAAHASGATFNHFRGAITSYRYGSWVSAVFLSYRKLDAHIMKDTIVSMPMGGYHRTISELNNKSAATNYLFGGHISYYKSDFNLGINTYYSIFDHVVYPPIRTSNQYFFRGRTASGLSLDYYRATKRLTLQGECALDGKWRIATSNRLQYSLNDDLSLYFQHRYLSKCFAAPFAKTIQTGGRVANEQGVLFGATLSSFYNCSLHLYVDYSHFSLPRLGVSKSSNTWEGYLKLRYILTNNSSLHLIYRLKAKEASIKGFEDLLEYKTTQRLRLQAAYSSEKITLSSALSGVGYSQQTKGNSFGWMLSSRLSYKTENKWSFSSFVSLFFSEDAATALYDYVPHLYYASEFPAFRHHGFCLVGTSSYKWDTRLILSSRLGWMHYFNQNIIGTASQQIRGHNKIDLAFELTYNW
ncbi:helix-hairpin-helix domain-containing protein [Alloprevotella tannerae]|uniref:helix-hairpin-helix domain-containing protein n=1 Tax=Alloprevotella tannerae TaxID=76122 RepID=UPI0028D75684|nr:helix-hairpin-helix domain-containing protein [Alloprevotella tannerae]